MEYANFMKISTKLLPVIKQFKTILYNLLQAKFNRRGVGFYYKKPLFYTVIMPTIIFGFYILLIAPNRWVAESKVIVRNVSSGNNNPTALGFIIGEFNSISREDAFFLKEYIYSYDMFEYLDQNINLCRLYRQGVWDPFSRLFRRTAKEDALNYYKSKISVILEENSGVLTISAQGYKPKDAQAINKAIIERSEWFLNEISHKIAKDQILFFETQIKLATKRMNDAQKAIIAFQVDNNIIHPLIQAESGAKLIANLMAELASQEAELKALQSYLSNNAPQIVALQSKITALKQQINQESNLIAGGDTQSLNSIYLKFQNLEIEAKLAEEIYKTTIASLEKNNLNVDKQFKSLVIISSPTLPEKAILPKRLYNLILFFVIIIAIYGTTKLIVISIKEHT